MPAIECEGPLPANAFRIRQLPPGRVLAWLASGWRDMRAIGWPSYLHGLFVCLVGIALALLSLEASLLVLGLASAFVLVGPFLATGLYALSRRRERGSVGGLDIVVLAWRCAGRRLLAFNLLLLGAALAWVAISALLLGLFVNVETTSLPALLRYVLTQDSVHFLQWTVLGSLVAATVFACSVITIPLLMERDVSTRSAILTSVRTVSENPLTMVVWAICIAAATAASLATGMLGFILLYPLIGHASWHAYRDLAEIDDQELPQITDDQFENH